MFLPLYVIWHFSLAAFSIFSLFSSCGILNMIWCEIVLFWSCLFGFKMPSVHVCVCLYIDVENFLLWFHWIGFQCLYFYFISFFYTVTL
jgi:hypothetical protein